LHERFSSSRIHGEWFRRTAEVDAWLEEIDASLPSHALVLQDEDEGVELEIFSPQRKILLAAIVIFILYLLS